MRTTKDLIEELEAEKGKFFVVALAVGFERTTTFVFANEENRLEKLNAAVQVGGEPVGLIGLMNEGGNRATLYTRMLAEHAEDVPLKNYMRKLASSFGRAVEQSGTGVVLENVERRPGWVN